MFWGWVVPLVFDGVQGLCLLGLHGLLFDFGFDFM